MRAPHLSIELSLLGLLALLWGSSYLFVKIAVVEIPPVTLIAARVTIAALFLCLLMAARRETLPRRRVIWGRLALQSLFNSTAAWTILAWGQQFVDAGLASVLNSTSPLFVYLFLTLQPGRADHSKVKLAGAGLGLLGIVLIVGPGALHGLGSHIAGQLACLAGAALYAGAALHGRHFAALPATVTAVGTMICASIALVPLALILDQPWQLRPSAQALAASGVLAVFCTGAALLLYFRLVKTLGALGVASQSYLRMGVGVVLGKIFLGENLTPLQATGLVAVIMGTALINWPKPLPPAQSPAQPPR